MNPAPKLAAISPSRGDPFACQDVTEDVYVDVLRRTTEILDGTGLDWAMLGGVASAAWGRPRWTHDIDVFVRPRDAHVALRAFADAGLPTDRRDEHWLYKSIDRGVLVDILFKTVGDVYLDDEMVARVTRQPFHGVSVPVISAEDLVVIKAIAHNEPNPRHWFDALGVLARRDLDWDYVARRARTGRDRVDALLLYARSNDIQLPDRVLPRR